MKHVIGLPYIITHDSVHVQKSKQSLRYKCKKKVYKHNVMYDRHYTMPSARCFEFSRMKMVEEKLKSCHSLQFS